MQKLRIYQVDAFTGRLFGGNPAAVVPLEKWPEAATMQAIALENNLAETAFFVPEGDGFRLRWFTPEVEVKLCGHATLASAHVLFTILEPGRRAVKFETLSGTLTVVASGDRLVMDFPRWSLSAAPSDAPPGLEDREQHVGARERRVPAELHLDLGREPAQAEAVALGHEERGLGEVVLERDRLHGRGVEPRLEGHDGGRIAAEQPPRERVDLVDPELFHRRAIIGPPQENGDLADL